MGFRAFSGIISSTVPLCALIVCSAARMLPIGDLSRVAERAGQHAAWGRAPKILQAANSWRTGDPLPQELRRFRHYGADIPTTLDSDSLIAQVKNPALLAALVVDSGTDPECRE